MKKLLLKSMLLLCALITGTSAWAGVVNVLSEDFSSNNTIAKLQTAGWAFTGNKSIQSGWLQVASGSGAGTATTPAFAGLVGTSATLTFDLISSSATARTFTITGTNCKVDGAASTTKTAPANTGSASSITISITNASTESKIQFSAASSAGCRIDNVVVYYESSTPSSGASFANSTPSINWPTYTTYTQTATTATGYAGTSGASVSYSLSNNSCGASITDAATGEITFTKGGSVTVTATAVAIEGQFTQSSASYTLTVNDVRADADLAWSNSEVEIFKDAASYTLPTLTNPHSLTINNYTATGTDGLASVTSAGVVTVNTGTLGTATIKAIFGGNSDYKPSTVSYTITVVDPTVKGSKYNPYTVEEVIDLNPTSTSEAKATDVYVTGYIVGCCNGSSGALITNKTEYVNSNLALADDPDNTSNYISVQLSSGTNRTKFNVVDHPEHVGKTQLLIKADIFKYCGIPGLKNIDEMTKSGERVTVTVAGLATFASDSKLDFTNVPDLEAYIAKESAGVITLEQVNKVDAGTGVLLRALNGTTAFGVPVTTADADDATGNKFVRGNNAAVATSEGGNYNWILSKKGEVIGFYHANGNTVASNRAYLQTTTASARILLDFDNVDVTAIENVEVQKVDGQYFNLAGQRVANPTKGLYIVNGKKVVIK